MNATKFHLSTGEEITIRQAQKNDAKALLDLKLDYLKNTTTIPLFVNEYPNSIESEIELIERLELEKNSVLLVAEYGGKLIGNIDLNGNQRLKLFHTGVIGMGIHEDWRGRGIGSALLGQAIKWSEQNSFLQLIWLEVYQNNEAGVALYTKMGFENCGVIKNYFFENNSYIDKITMSKHVN